MSGVKRWGKMALAIAVVVGAIYFIAFHWERFISDFYPLDKATVSPNLLASVIQWAIILVAVSLFYPPWRKAIERFAGLRIDSLKEHVSAEHDALHEKLDHLMAHHPRKEVREFEPEVNRPNRPSDDQATPQR